jgi:hypothetical protein
LTCRHWERSQLISSEKYDKNQKVSSRPAIFENKINIDSIQDESTRNLNQNRLREKILSNGIADDDDVNASWSKLKQNIINAASEAVGMERFKSRFKRGSNPADSTM